MVKELYMEVEGRKSSKRMLIDYLKESKSLFKRLEDVAQTGTLKEKFGDSISNIDASIKIIETTLSREEIKLLVKQIRQNIQDDKI